MSMNGVKLRGPYNPHSGYGRRFDGQKDVTWERDDAWRK